MTREEIEKFSGIEPNCFETDREKDWYKIGCIDGLDAADACPDTTSLQHESREEPKGNEWIVLCQDKYGACFLVEYRPYSDSDETWDEYVNSLFIAKWVYIKDILPKKEL